LLAILLAGARPQPWTQKLVGVRERARIELDACDM
jgi:hypothetical protein